MENEFYLMLVTRFEDIKDDIIRIEEKIDHLNDRKEEKWDDHNIEHQQIWMDISALRIKAGIWGIIGGAMIVLLTAAIEFTKNYLIK